MKTQIEADINEPNIFVDMWFNTVYQMCWYCDACEKQIGTDYCLECDNPCINLVDNYRERFGP
jgi:hypothetical protein